MQHEVLQITIRGADRAAEPRRNKDANRGQPVGMNVEEAENLRLGEADGVQDGAGLQSATFAEFDDHLHAERPFAGAVAFGHAKLRVDFAPDRSHRAVAYYGQRGPQVHAWRKTCVGASLQISALICETDACNRSEEDTPEL